MSNLKIRYTRLDMTAPSLLSSCETLIFNILMKPFLALIALGEWGDCGHGKGRWDNYLAIETTCLMRSLSVGGRNRQVSL